MHAGIAVLFRIGFPCVCYNISKCGGGLQNRKISILLKRNSNNVCIPVNSPYVKVARGEDLANGRKHLTLRSGMMFLEVHEIYVACYEVRMIWREFAVVANTPASRICNSHPEFHVTRNSMCSRH